MTNEWSDYVEYEKNNQRSNYENIQARETVIALPNDLATTPKILEEVCDDLGQNLYGSNRDYEYAVHWNESRTNLHCHFIYSERERNTEQIEKIYKRDMWYDKDTNKMAKANAENAELRFKKGDKQKNSDGTIKYGSDPFTVKDKKYNNKNWLSERNEIIQRTFLEHGYKLDIQNDDSPYLSQVKLYKGANEDYLNHAAQYNKVVQDYNHNTKKLIQFDSVQKENMIEVKQELKKDIKQFNSKSRTLNVLSTKHLESMKETIKNTLHNMKQFMQSHTEPVGMKVKSILDDLANIVPKQNEVDTNLKAMQARNENQMKSMTKTQQEMKQEEQKQEHEYSHSIKMSL